MVRTKHWHEYLLLLVNRGAIPASTFLALSVFQRVMNDASFESFLLAFSLCQWLLAFGFQWQKNVAVRLFHYRGYFRISLATLSATVMLSTLVYIGFSYFAKIDFLLGGLIYTLVAGMLYYFSTNYRMTGSVRLYANVDTAFQVLRWGVAVAAVILIPVADAAFWGAALALLPALILFLVLRRSQESDGPRLTWREYLGTGIWMAVFDLAGSGMMYVDRFYIQDSDYILHSTVSNQIGSVLFGALIATAYPRVSLSWKQGGDAWRNEFKRLAGYIPLLLVLTPVLCATAGPVLLRLLSPEARIDVRVLVIGGFSQSIHHVIYFLSILFILYGRNFVSSSLYLCAFIAYTVSLILIGSHSWLLVSALRLVFLMLGLVVIGVVAMLFRRRVRADAAAG